MRARLLSKQEKSVYKMARSFQTGRETGETKEGRKNLGRGRERDEEQQRSLRHR